MNFSSFIQKYVNMDTIPDISVIDIVEIIILAVLIYEIMNWVKRTRAWVLMRGFIILIAFVFVAWAFRMNTILFLFKNVFSVGIIALVILFQPELRRGLEQLGQSKLLSGIFNSESSRTKEEGFTDKSINEITKAAFEMGKAKTGALIVIEKTTPLGEYERTGIALDSLISSQLLINIFEHNTPLHDGAVLIRGGRIVSATCYLPLSDSLHLSKELGTRHRAAVGISEVTDSCTIVVSEETGFVSVASGGHIRRNLDPATLKGILGELKSDAQDSRRTRLWRGRGRNEGKADK